MEKEISGYQLETCFGPRGCPNRAIVCPGLAAELRECLQARDIASFLKRIVPGPLKRHHEFRISLSDCPNACSQPQIADIGLIGACQPTLTPEACSLCYACREACPEGAISFTGNRPGVDKGKCLACGKCSKVCPTGTLQEGQKGYRLLLGGKLGRHPRLATELPGLVAPEDLPGIIEHILDYYLRHCRQGERLGEILERAGWEEMAKKSCLDNMADNPHNL